MILNIELYKLLTFKSPRKHSKMQTDQFDDLQWWAKSAKMEEQVKLNIMFPLKIRLHKKRCQT